MKYLKLYEEIDWNRLNPFGKKRDFSSVYDIIVKNEDCINDCLSDLSDLSIHKSIKKLFTSYNGGVVNNGLIYILFIREKEIVEIDERIAEIEGRIKDIDERINVKISYYNFHENDMYGFTIIISSEPIKNDDSVYRKMINEFREVFPDVSIYRILQAEEEEEEDEEEEEEDEELSGF